MIAPDSIRAVGSIPAMVPLRVRDHGADLSLGNHLARDLGLTAEPPHRLAAGDLAHVVFDGVPRPHRLAKFTFVDGEEINRLRIHLVPARKNAQHPASL